MFSKEDWERTRARQAQKTTPPPVPQTCPRCNRRIFGWCPAHGDPADAPREWVEKSKKREGTHLL